MSEILAPAGSESSAKAAINADADAIYLGLDKFSARSSAENFDTTKLESVCKYARAFGVKVYAALNTVVKDCELNDFFAAAVSAWNAGADALIIQDIFIGKFLKERCPEMRLHLSTQAGTCNAYGAAVAKKFGFDRVILARETRLDDIAEISKIIETEVFVQGALCTCFSGQCYLSSFAGGNSGNRGRCKQPCRKKYSIDRKGFEDSAYRLSLADLCVGEKIEDYIAAGVTSFKIEGRMRRPEYVAAAVRYYKTVLKSGADEGLLSDLKRTYNRGNYTKGLAFGQDKSFISSAVQGHIGEFAGIIKVENSKYILQTNARFAAGDGCKILRGGSEIGGGILADAYKGGYIINSRIRLKNGDKAFITTDNALTSRLLSLDRLIPVNVKAEFFAGNIPVVEINGITFKGERPLERANNRPLTVDEITRCFKKVDGLPFAPEICAETDGVFIPLSELNSLRRAAYSGYYEAVTQNRNRRYSSDITIPEMQPRVNGMEAVIATDLKASKAQLGILKPSDYSDISICDFSGEKYLYLPPFLSGADIEKASVTVRDFDGIYCDGYYGLELANKWNKKLFAGTGFNITNRLSLSLCKANNICLSKELTLREADALSGVNVFYLSGGGIKVMDLIYCPFEKKCASCDKRGLYTLTDENGRKFPLRRYKMSDCVFELYNCADLTDCNCKAGKLVDETVASGNFTRGHSVNGIY